MLTKISRGICLHRVHTVSATITPNTSHSVYIRRNNIHQLWQELAKDFCGMRAVFCLNIVFAKSTEKSLYSKDHSKRVL